MYVCTDPLISRLLEGSRLRNLTGRDFGHDPQGKEAWREQVECARDKVHSLVLSVGFV